jgi:hypothetical protein
MQVSYGEDLASHFGLQRRAGIGNGVCLSVRGEGNAGQPLSSEIITSVCRSCPDREKAMADCTVTGEEQSDAAESQTLCMRGNSRRENREIPSVSHLAFNWERSENVSDGTADMYADGKSHDPIVPAKRANKAGTPAAESVEERGSPRGNDDRTSWSQTQRWKWPVIMLRSATAGRDTCLDRLIPREEPYEVMLHVRICAGGGP